MDELLKHCADAGVEVSAAETALDEDDLGTARAALEHAGTLLADLRARWPEMNGAERAVVGPAAKTVKDRLDAATARLPQHRALSEAAPEVDPEQDAAPDDDAGG